MYILLSGRPPFAGDNDREIMDKVAKGKYDLETQIPIAIYSSLISIICKTPLTLLGLSNDRIIGFKQNHSTQGIQRRSEELTTCLKLKFALYYLL